MKALILLGALLLGMPLHAAQLVLDLGADSRTWQTEELLQHRLAQTIHVTDDVSYKRDMDYRAVPLAALLTGVEADHHLQAWAPCVASKGAAASSAAKPSRATACR